jgi:type II secretory pathway component GspD/PulD (secretin)
MNRTRLVIVVGSLFAASMTAHAGVPADPLEARVTIDYRAASAADVIRTLAAAAGLKVEIGAGQMRPVTITLTNVRLGNALNALCDNALCSWILSGSLKVTPLPSEKSALLPPRVSFSLQDTPPTEVFRALGAAIGVVVTIEPSLPTEPVTMNFKDASTAEVLNMLCNMLQCVWDFDPARGLSVTRKR